MKISELCSDLDSVKTFNGLSAELLKASSYFSGDVDPDSISALDPDSVQEIEEAYGHLLDSVRKMDRFFQSVERPSKNKIDWKEARESERLALMEFASQEAQLKAEADAKRLKPGQFKQSKEDILAAIKYGVS